MEHKHRAHAFVIFVRIAIDLFTAIDNTFAFSVENLFIGSIKIQGFTRHSDICTYARVQLLLYNGYG
jgi:hypothetical protein